VITLLLHWSTRSYRGDADAVDELLGRHILQREAARAGPQGVVAVVHGYESGVMLPGET
jgi:hypothetical protein